MAQIVPSTLNRATSVPATTTVAHVPGGISSTQAASTKSAIFFTSSARIMTVYCRAASVLTVTVDRHGLEKVTGGAIAHDMMPLARCAQNIRYQRLFKYPPPAGPGGLASPERVYLFPHI